MVLGILGFLLTIGILVTLHEWGHFYVARCFNVKILRFSLGFGKPLWTWVGQKDGTQYTLAPLPFGGYVQMLGETEEQGLSEEDKKRTFHAQAAWKRFLIVAAGPFINLVFAVVAFGGLYVWGVEGLRPEVVRVAPESYAERAGLQVGDEILSIAGREVRLSHDAAVALVGAPLVSEVEIWVKRGEENKALYLDLSHIQAGDERHMAQSTGLYLAGEWYSMQVAEVVDNSPAQALGLQVGDEILSLNGQAVDFISGRLFIRDNPNQAVNVEIKRFGERLTLSGTLGEQMRDGVRLGYLGVSFMRPQVDDWVTVERYGIFKALWFGWEKTKNFTTLTWQMFGRMLTGKASLDNVGGPISIGDMAGQSLRYGADVFFNFLGVVSLSLAALNLLPIPALDGGHMLLCLLEMVRGKALSANSQQWLNRLGAGLLYAFMGFVLFKDFGRYLGGMLG
ncbi:MAG: RIP metalloprotease RseP [Cardiobacteriaceae bacterium]|nr:RIP metalloprotease RseP [Cardiobacteriaceae bacterium]